MLYSVVVLMYTVDGRCRRAISWLRIRDAFVSPNFFVNDVVDRFYVSHHSANPDVTVLILEAPKPNVVWIVSIARGQCTRLRQANKDV
jgi:hypothetical protein